MREIYHEVVSTSGTVIRLYPDELKLQKESEEEPSLPSHVGSGGGWGMD